MHRKFVIAGRRPQHRRLLVWAVTFLVVAATFANPLDTVRAQEEPAVEVSPQDVMSEAESVTAPNQEARNIQISNQIYLPSVSRRYVRCLYERSPHAFGVQMYGATNSASSYYPALIQSGADWVRVPIHWAEIEPVNTTPEFYRWARADAAVAASTEACLGLIVTHDDNPTWAATNSQGVIDKADLDELAQYIGALVERYDGDGIADAPGSPIIDHFEFYNEPDAGGITPFARWGHNGKEYAEMLAAVYPVIKYSNPDAKVVFGGISHDWFEDDPIPGPFVREFLDNVLENGGGEYFDVMNFHFYPTFAGTWTDNFGPGLYEKTEYIREKLQSYGLTLPMMVTETSWHSHETLNGVQTNNTGTPELQARYVVALYTQGLAQHLRAMIFWMLYDPGGSYYWASGLVTNDTIPTPKPSFAAYQVAANVLGTRQFDRRLTEDEMRAEDMEAYAFRNSASGETTYVAWMNPIDLDIFPSKYPGKTVRTDTLRLPGSNARVIDIYGNNVPFEARSVQQSNGYVKVEITNQPVYIIIQD